MRIRAVAREARRARIITKAICLNIIPTTPLIKIRGRKIATVVRQEAMTALPTSEEPKMAASEGLSPSSR